MKNFYWVGIALAYLAVAIAGAQQVPVTELSYNISASQWYINQICSGCVTVGLGQSYSAPTTATLPTSNIPNGAYGFVGTGAGMTIYFWNGSAWAPISSVTIIPTPISGQMTQSSNGAVTATQYGSGNLYMGVGVVATPTNGDVNCTNLGHGAGQYSSNGLYGVKLGFDSWMFDTSIGDTGLGAYTGQYHTSGGENTFGGVHCGEWSDFGTQNSLYGQNCGSGSNGQTMVGSYISAYGALCAARATNPQYCDLFGWECADADSFSGNQDSIFGTVAGFNITTGIDIAAVGVGAAGAVTTQSYISCLGEESLGNAYVSQTDAWGWSSAQHAIGQNDIFGGLTAGLYFNGNYATVIGQGAANAATCSYPIIIGFNEDQNETNNYAFAVGSNGHDAFRGILGSSVTAPVTFTANSYCVGPTPTPGANKYLIVPNALATPVTYLYFNGGIETTP